VLVVDDVEMNRDVLARRLRQLGHTVETSENGKQALEMLDRSEFDLILLDIMMPDMDGYEVLERLRTDGRHGHIPVIMISAVDQIESVVRCIELGATDYLSKPFNSVLLQARVGATLARKRLRDRERLYARSLEREMQIGREIQASFLPETLPEAPGWQIAASFQPARQVAGDFYDAFRLRGGSLGLVVADVCDKGVGAALFMALFRTLLRASADLDIGAPAPAERDEGDVEARVLASVRLTNDYIARIHGRSNMFATIFFGVLDPESGWLVYANAGQEPAIVRRASGALERLNANGPAVGLLPEMTFRTSRTLLAPADLLLAFTDGVTEARSPAGAFYQDERLLARVAEPISSASLLLDEIEKDVAAHTADAEPSDDITMLAVLRA
jgi:sigma-B regulation protein RsbU (phosphoserine phosphatase)